MRKTQIHRLLLGCKFHCTTSAFCCFVFASLRFLCSYRSVIKHSFSLLCRCASWGGGKAQLYHLIKHEFQTRNSSEYPAEDGIREPSSEHPYEDGIHEPWLLIFCHICWRLDKRIWWSGDVEDAVHQPERYANIAVVLIIFWPLFLLQAIYLRIYLLFGGELLVATLCSSSIPFPSLNEP